MTNKGYIQTLALMGLALAGCTDDNSEIAEDKLVPLNLCALGNTRLQEGESALTRANDDAFVPGTGGAEDPEGVPGFIPYNKLYPLPINVEYTTIGAFLTEDSKDSYNSLSGYFSYKEDNSWSTTVGIKPGNFYIFGYMPSNMSGMKASIKKRTTTWNDGCVLTLQDLSTVTPADVCVVVGVLKGTTDMWAIDDAENVVPIIHQGVYSYEGAEKDNFVYLLLDHLYTNVNLELCVEPKYAQLRTIVLKEVYMQSTVNSTVDLNITLGTDRKQPIEDVSYGQSQIQRPVNAMIMDETQATAISSDALHPTSVPGYFAPGMTTQAFNFEFVYDVYDKKNIDETHPYGNLVRQNCHAINKWSLSGTTVSAGKSFKVTATIKPTYLYQLSEPDLDNPTIVLN